MSVDLLRYVRDVADFPKPGVVFKDLTPLLADARGFIFGAAAAHALGAGFVPMRKPRKLPAKTIGVDYALEYGSDRLEMHADALVRGERVLVVDDVLATGGTLAAAADLCDAAGAAIAGASVMAEIAFLAGRSRWRHAAPLHAVLRFD
jgi:adenine phosphoribosyltransferase